MDYATLAKSVGGTSVDYGNLASSLGGKPQEPQDTRDFLTKASDFVGSIFPGQQIGKTIGTLGGYIYTKAHDLLTGSDYSKYYNLQAPTIQQNLGDIAQGALTVALPGAGEGAGLVGRVGAQAAVGAGLGASGAVAQGSTNLGDITQNAALGGVLGGTVGIAAEGVSKLAEKLPQRIINNLLPQLKTSGRLDYAIENTALGSPEKMLATSDAAKASYNKQIDAILQHPENADKFINGQDVIGKTLSDFPNSEYTPESIIGKIKSQVPSEAATITKLAKGEITLEEANTLRKAIDNITFKTAIDSPEIKAGKDLAAAVGSSLRDLVQTGAPETQPVFLNFSKEIDLNKALKKLVQRSQKKGLFGFKELLGALGAEHILGPVGGLGVLTGEKVANLPVARVAAAKTLKAIAPAIKQVSKVSGKAGTLMAKNIPSQADQTIQ